MKTYVENMVRMSYNLTILNNIQFEDAMATPDNENQEHTPGREAKKVDKRRRILEAAVRSFSADGFYRTRIGDIAKAANVATGTVYTYFESKENIHNAVFDDFMSRFLARGRDTLEGCSDAREKLHRVVELHLRNLGEDRDLTTVFQIELRHSARFMHLYSRSEHLKEYFSMIDSILREGQKEGTIRAGLDTWFATLCIFGILDEAVTNWVLSDRNYRLTTDVDRVLNFVLKGVG